MNTTARRRFAPAATLFVLAPLVGEVLFGAIPLSRLPFGLLVVHSLFDQHYRGLDFLGFYGHWLGVNWVWLEFIVPYHAVFSIAIPIVATELLFPERRNAPWVGARGLIGVASLFVANCVLLA